MNQNFNYEITKAGPLAGLPPTALAIKPSTVLVSQNK
jgi:hypothetical protein